MATAAVVIEIVSPNDETGHSGVIGLDAERLAGQLDWPT